MRDDCVIWEGSIGEDGYGRVNRPKEKPSPQLVHRREWELHNGPIPENHEIHHLCGVRACHNISHLEMLTKLAHMREHGGWTDTMCRNGHEGSLYVLPSTGTRRCAECNREADRRYKRKRAAA